MADGAQIASLARERCTNAGEFGDCSRCDKRGLPVLPLRFSYAYWKGRTATEQRANLSPTDYSGLSGELLLRPVSQGYIHVLDARNGGSWRVFFVDKDGGLWEFPPKTTPVIDDFACGRCDHSIRSSMLMVAQPRTAGRIWVSYASTLYTPSQLDAFKDAILKLAKSPELNDPELRNKKERFQEFDVPALLAMSVSNTDSAKACALSKDGKTLRDRVPEFGGKIEPFQNSITKPRDLTQAAALIGERAHGACSGGIGGVALYLDDPVGIAQEVRHRAKQAKLQVDAVKAKFARELNVKRIVDQLGVAWYGKGSERERFEKKAEWINDYFSKLDPGLIEDFEIKYKIDLGALEGELSLICLDASRYIKSKSLDLAIKCDFDVDDPASAVTMVQQLGTILSGLNLDETGRKLAQDLLDRPIEDNLWYRAMLAGQKSLIGFLANDQANDVLVSFKAAYSVVDEWISARQAMAGVLNLAGSTDISKAPGAAAYLEGVDPLFRATLPLVESVKQMTIALQGMLSEASTANFKSSRILALVGAVWHRTIAVPFYEERTLASLVRENNEAAWGASIDTRNQQLVDPERGRVTRVRLGDYASELGEAGQKKIAILRVRFGDVSDAASLLGDESGGVSRQQRRQHERAGRKAESNRAKQQGAPKKTTLSLALDRGLKDIGEEFAILRQAEAESARASAAAARNRSRVGLPNASSTGPLVVPAALATLQRSPGGSWTSKALSLARSGAVNGAFSAWVGAMQMTALVSSCKGLEQKPDITTWAKVIGSVLGLAGAFAEVVAAGYLLAGTAADKTLFLRLSPVRIAGIGGVIGGVSGIVGGIVTIADGLERRAEKDHDSGAASIVGGVLLAASGVAATFSGFATIAGGLVFGLGPVAWGVFALGVAVMGIASVFFADQWRDNALQTWLRSCCFGIMPRYFDGAQESAAFEKLFEIPMELRMQWRKGRFGFGTIEVEFDIPDMSAGKGTFLYALAFGMADGGSYTVSQQRRIAGSVHEGLIDPQGLASSAIGRVKGLMPPSSGGIMERTSSGGVRWEVRYLPDSLASVAMRLKYYPEFSSRPDFIIPAPDGMAQVITMADSK